MFKNFDKVFKFTFRNQVSPSGFKTLTTVVAILLFAVPMAVLAILASKSKDTSVLEPCGVKKFYVVNETSPIPAEEDYSLLAAVGNGQPGYDKIAYVASDSVDSAIKAISDAKEKESAVLLIRKGESRAVTRIIIPDDSELSKKTVKNYEHFIDNNSYIFSFQALKDVDPNALISMITPVEQGVYSENGKDLFADEAAIAEQTTATIKPIFNMVLIFATIMIVYFMVIFYGNSIMQNIVLEKNSKLMDTMLVSVRPQAMIFGKMLGSLSAAIMQCVIWLVSLVAGFFAGVKVAEIINPGHEPAFVVFLKNMGSMGLFTPASVVIAIFVLLLGIVFYSTIAAICGAISGSREEAAGNQGLFVMILVVSFYFVLFAGIKENPALWMFIVPCTAAMILPAGVCAGTVSVVIAVISLVIMLACTVFLVILAGKLYTMMSLYKGNKVDIVKAIKMLTAKQ
ncbi:MAG: ABC transporter permease [Lachnospiraceae bacterium]|nr:ABC transporter permease [Lachnospiraceae bacterium]